MNFVPPRSASLQALAQKIQTQNLNLQELGKISQCCHQQQDDLFEWAQQFEKDLGQSERQIYECQLPLLLKFLRNSQANQMDYPIKGLGLKLIKFFSHQFDSRPDSQKKACKIYCIAGSGQNDPISEDEINLVFRLINKFGISTCEAFQHLMTKISTPGQPVNIIQMINNCGSFSMIEKLIDSDRNYNYTINISSIIIETAGLFSKFINQQELKGEKIDEKLYQQINLKFLSVVKKCIKKFENQEIYQNFAAKLYLNSIIEVNEKVPAFEFSFQKFYLNYTEIDTQYLEPQDQIYRRLYQSGILMKLQGLYDYEMGWQNHEVIRAINLIIRPMDFEDFEAEVVPFVQRFLEKGNAMEKTKIFSQLLIKFIYANNQYEQSKEFFVRVFCESKIFNGVIDTINKRIGHMLSTERFGTQKQKENMQDCSNLFYLLVLAFEIIQNCQILNKIYKETRDLLERSVGFFKGFSNIKWQGKVLDELLSQMLDQQKNEKIQGYRYDQRKRYFKF